MLDYTIILFLFIFFIYGVKQGLFIASLKFIILLLAVLITYFYFDSFHTTSQKIIGEFENKKLFYLISISGMLFIGWAGMFLASLALPLGATGSPLYFRFFGGFINLTSGAIIISFLLFFLEFSENNHNRMIGLSMLNNNVLPPLIGVMPPSVLKGTNNESICLI